MHKFVRSVGNIFPISGVFLNQTDQSLKCIESSGSKSVLFCTSYLAED